MDFYKRIIKSRKMRQDILKLLSWVPDKTMLKIQYWIKMGRKLNLKNPKRYTEKLQWYKLYYRNPNMVRCVDKYDVREYVKEKGLEEILNECYGVYDSVDEIDFDLLPDQFVIKDTLGGGGNSVLICKDKSELDVQAVRKQLNEWANVKIFKSGGREWPYYFGKNNRIIIEKLLKDKSNSDNAIDDYKFLCFNGKPEYVVYDVERFTGHKRNIYDTNWNNLNIASDCPCSEKEYLKPEKLPEMLEIAEILAEDFPAVRVDLYCVEGEIYFGELTFFPWSGYVQFQPDSFDFEIGEKFVLPEKMEGNL